MLRTLICSRPVASKDQKSLRTIATAREDLSTPFKLMKGAIAGVSASLLLASSASAVDDLSPDRFVFDNANVLSQVRARFHLCVHE